MFQFNTAVGVTFSSRSSSHGPPWWTGYAYTIDDALPAVLEAVGVDLARYDLADVLADLHDDRANHDPDDPLELWADHKGALVTLRWVDDAADLAYLEADNPHAQLHVRCFFSTDTMKDLDAKPG